MLASAAISTATSTPPAIAWPATNTQAAKPARSKTRPTVTKKHKRKSLCSRRSCSLAPLGSPVNVLLDHVQHPTGCIKQASDEIRTCPPKTRSRDDPSCWHSYDNGLNTGEGSGAPPPLLTRPPGHPLPGLRRGPHEKIAGLALIEPAWSFLPLTALEQQYCRPRCRPRATTGQAMRCLLSAPLSQATSCPRDSHSSADTKASGEPKTPGCPSSRQ